jgi:hypothetical protein
MDYLIIYDATKTNWLIYSAIGIQLLIKYSIYKTTPSSNSENWDHPAGKFKKKKKSHLYRGKINQAKYSSLPLKGPGIVKAHDVNFP